jgi:hypothetical protein
LDVVKRIPIPVSTDREIGYTERMYALADEVIIGDGIVTILVIILAVFAIIWFARHL